MRLWDAVRGVLGLKDRCRCGAATSWTPGVLRGGLIDRGEFHSLKRCQDVRGLPVKEGNPARPAMRDGKPLTFGEVLR